jgi:hypothetical protein
MKSKFESERWCTLQAFEIDKEFEWRILCNHFDINKIAY